jgi:hypothetical protein
VNLRDGDLDFSDQPCRWALSWVCQQSHIPSIAGDAKSVLLSAAPSPFSALHYKHGLQTTTCSCPRDSFSVSAWSSQPLPDHCCVLSWPSPRIALSSPPSWAVRMPSAPLWLRGQHLVPSRLSRTGPGDCHRSYNAGRPSLFWRSSGGFPSRPVTTSAGTSTRRLSRLSFTTMLRAARTIPS